MKKEIRFLPAWDKRNADPEKNYGIHGVEMRWYLKGEFGIIQFVVYTGWQLPHVQAEQDSEWNNKFSQLICYPKPTDVGYHSPKPMYEGHTSTECDLLDGGKCYYDGSSLFAEDMFQLLVEKGDEAVWEKLEEVYKDRFGELK